MTKTLDWQKIARDYQFSSKSIGQIARENSCSRTAVQKKAKREGWARGNANAPAAKPATATKPAPAKPATAEIAVKRGRGRPQVWTDEAVDAVLSKFSQWLDDDPDNLHLTQFAEAIGLSSSQLGHILERSERFSEGLQRFKPIIADRIARLGSRSKLNPTFSIFWLKQFGWTDRQDIRVEHSSGAALEAAINRVYNTGRIAGQKRERE